MHRASPSPYRKLFQRWFRTRCQYQYSTETEPLGTAGAIRNASPLLDNEFFILNGIPLLLSTQRTIRRIQNMSQVGIMLVYDNHHKVAPNNVC